jgi:hypothetical protein
MNRHPNAHRPTLCRLPPNGWGRGHAANPKQIRTGYHLLPNRSVFCATEGFLRWTRCKTYGERSPGRGLTAGASTTTLPMRIFNYTEYNFDPTINAVSTIFVVLALVLISVLDRLIGLARLG